MQEWLGNNDFLLYYTHIRSKLVMAKGFIKTSKIYKRMTAIDSKSYVPYLNKLVDQCNNTYHHSIKKTPLKLIILLRLKTLGQILKLLNLKYMIE